MPVMTPFGPGGYGNNPQADQWLMQQMMSKRMPVSPRPQDPGMQNPFLSAQFQPAAQLPPMMQPQMPNFGGQMPPNYINQMGQIGPQPTQAPASPIPQPPLTSGQNPMGGWGGGILAMLDRLKTNKV